MNIERFYFFANVAALLHTKCNPYYLAQHADDARKFNIMCYMNLLNN